MNLIDGKTIAERINEQTREKVERLKERGITPGLAVVLVGDNPASIAYVRNKDRTSQKLGFFSRKIELPTDASQSDLLKIVDDLNADAAIHGILGAVPSAAAHQRRKNRAGDRPGERCRRISSDECRETCNG